MIAGFLLCRFSCNYIRIVQRMQSYAFQVISKRSRSTFFFLRDRTGTGPCPEKQQGAVYIYRDINLSPIPARCDGIFGLQLSELGYELRNGFCVNSHIFMRQWRGLRVYQFMSLRKGMATIMTMKRNSKQPNCQIFVVKSLCSLGWKQLTNKEATVKATPTPTTPAHP